MQAAYNEKQRKHVRAAFEKELTKFPAEQRDKLRVAFDTAAAKRSDEQKKLVAANPKLNVNPGVLYQYEPAAAEELKKLQARILAKRAEKPVEDFVAVLNEVPGQVPVTWLFHRGDYRQPRDEVGPGDLTIAAPDGKRLELPARGSRLPTTGRRLAYAEHLTSGNHPLVGRVLANRLWLHHLGRGIVDTPGDFGVLGQRPTHPELLDFLATELVRQSWSLKRMHRLIMTSTVYRQSSRRTPAQDAVDSANALYGRYSVHRLEAEILRDRILATTGRLDRTLFGPPVPVVEDSVGQVIVPNDKPRRSIYVQARRSKPVAFLTTFDAPGGELNCERRISSTAAPQALMLMNNEFILQEARHLAQRLGTGTPPNYAREQVAELIARYPRHTEAWSYGFGEYDAARRLVRFTPLPHWTGSSWQGGSVLPDSKLGWVIVHAAGGHAGNDQQHASVRRWLAPRDGTLVIAGKLKHPSPNGDGVRGRIVSGRHALLGEWTVKARETSTDAKSVGVKAGDTIDFAVDCLGDVTSDSYEWAVQLKLTSPAGEVDTWNSATEFHGPVPAALAQQLAHAWQISYQRPAALAELDVACRFVLRQTRQLRLAGNPNPELAALTNLCQQLLASNEFLYVD